MVPDDGGQHGRHELGVEPVRPGGRGDEQVPTQTPVTAPHAVSPPAASTPVILGEER